MPYARCRGCGLTTFIVRSYAWAWECPRCGDAFHQDAEGGGAPGGEESVAHLLRRARTALGMDVALLTEIRDGREIAREVAGEWPGLGPLAGGSVAVDDSFCKRMLEGRIGNVVPDVAADERVRDLALARALGVGAWAGVPVSASLARLYVLCCLAREAKPSLGANAEQLLRRLAGGLAPMLEATAAPR